MNVFSSFLHTTSAKLKMIFDELGYWTAKGIATVNTTDALVSPPSLIRNVTLLNLSPSKKSFSILK